MKTKEILKNALEEIYNSSLNHAEKSKQWIAVMIKDPAGYVYSLMNICRAQKDIFDISMIAHLITILTDAGLDKDKTITLLMSYIPEDVKEKEVNRIIT